MLSFLEQHHLLQHLLLHIDFSPGMIQTVTHPDEFLPGKDTNLGYENHNPQIPVAFQLGQNFPNPFNLGTTIWFGIPIQERVTLKVFDLLGREVATRVDQELSAGEHRVGWDGQSSDSFPHPQACIFTGCKCERLALPRE